MKKSLADLLENGFLNKYIKDDEEESEKDDLYFIKIINRDIFKIGRSNDCFKRMQSIQTGNYEELKLYSEVSKCGHLESYVHYLFEDCNIRGEWYSIGFNELFNVFIRLLKEKGKMESKNKELESRNKYLQEKYDILEANHSIAPISSLEEILEDADSEYETKLNMEKEEMKGADV